MPGRDIIFQNNGIYHVFNRTIDKKRIFHIEKHCNIFLNTLAYYRSDKSTVSLSRLPDLPKDIRVKILKEVAYTTSFDIHILAYCLMPTHFHLLLQQKKGNGIQKSMTYLMNSFTQHYNKLSKRVGPLFLPRFKAVRVTSDAQLMHVSRYIHLNPYSSKIINSKSEIAHYPYSSYPYYLTSQKNQLVQPKKVMELFRFNRKEYEDFVIKNADYQQTLERVKYTFSW